MIGDWKIKGRARYSQIRSEVALDIGVGK